MDLRQYDPAIGRWVVQDPIVHHDFSPYSAFDNNPVYWSDPSGADATTYTLNGNLVGATFTGKDAIDAFLHLADGSPEKTFEVAVTKFYEFSDFDENNGNGGGNGNGKGGGKKDNRTLKQKYVDNLLSSHNMNSMLQMAYSIVGDVLIESTEYGDFVTNLREALYKTYGDYRSERINEEISMIVNVVKALKQNIDRGNVSDRYFTMTGIALLAKATEFGIKNIAIEKQIQFLDNDVYQRNILRKHLGGSFSGGGAGYYWY